MNYSFHSLKELISALDRAKLLLSEMFGKRKSFSYKLEDALLVSGMDEDKIDDLKSKGILRQNGPYLEIDDEYLGFFEQILEVNEEVNTSFIHENILQIRQNINYYLQEANDGRKYTYLKAIKYALRKTGRIVYRNIVDLQRNIENTFKTEPNYKIKISKLENYDRKRTDLLALIEQTHLLMTEDEQTFFKIALDEEMREITIGLRTELNDARHNLIEMQKQIIEFLNQIKYQSRFLEHLRQVKYLKDQFELKTKTDINSVLRENQSVFFESKPAYPLKVSLEFLQGDEADEILRRLRTKIKTGSKLSLPLAGKINKDYLDSATDREIYINLDELRNGFMASGINLYDFIMAYNFPKAQSYEEKITVFCQMVSLYGTDFSISENFGRQAEIEYAMIYPK